MELYLWTVVAGATVALVVGVMTEVKQRKSRAKLLDTYREWLEDVEAGRLRK